MIYSMESTRFLISAYLCLFSGSLFCFDSTTNFVFRSVSFWIDSQWAVGMKFVTFLMSAKYKYPAQALKEITLTPTFAFSVNKGFSMLRTEKLLLTGLCNDRSFKTCLWQRLGFVTKKWNILFLLVFYYDIPKTSICLNTAIQK